jgi:hypothetical protein
MKKILLLFIGLILVTMSAYTQVAINEDASDPESSAMLDISSTHLGLLIPRMNFSQMYRIEKPATGLLIFNLSVNTFFFYNGKEWVNLLNTESEKFKVLNIKTLMHINPNEAPEKPKTGDLYMDINTKTLRCWNGTEWKNLW